MRDKLYIIHVPGTLAYQVCKDEEEFSVSYVPESKLAAAETRIKELEEKVNFFNEAVQNRDGGKAGLLFAENAKMREALQKIDDPMKYHHWEEDPYTRAACFQFIASEALKG